jgi:DNA-binding FrmR family transcriptional regulator
MKKNCQANHPDYKKHIPRINKVVGQLNGIKKND